MTHDGPTGDRGLRRARGNGRGAGVAGPIRHAGGWSGMTDAPGPFAVVGTDTLARERFVAVARHGPPRRARHAAKPFTGAVAIGPDGSVAFTDLPARAPDPPRCPVCGRETEPVDRGFRCERCAHTW